MPTLLYALVNSSSFYCDRNIAMTQKSEDNIQFKTGTYKINRQENTFFWVLYIRVLFPSFLCVKDNRKDANHDSWLQQLLM